MKPLLRRLTLEALNDRCLLAIDVADDAYETTQEVPLHIGFDAPEFVSLDQTRSIWAGGNVVDMQHSDQHNQLALRNSGSLIRIMDLSTGTAISAKFADNYFSDLSVSPDGNYFFAIDPIPGGTSNTSWLHRFDAQSRTWSSWEVPDGSRRIAIVGQDRIVLQIHDHASGPFAVALFEFSEGGLLELTRATCEGGQMEYDPSTGRLYVSGASTTDDLQVLKVVGDRFVHLSPERLSPYPVFSQFSSISADREYLFRHNAQIEADDTSNQVHWFPQSILAASSTVAFGSQGEFYAMSTGETLGSLPFDVGPILVTSNEQEAWAFNTETDELHHLELTTAIPGILLNDTTDLGSLEIIGSAGPQNGTLDLNAEGQFIYNPDPGFSGVDSFEYTVENSIGQQATGLVEIEVLPAQLPNSPPEASPINLFVEENSQIAIAEANGDTAAGVRLVNEFSAHGNVRQLVHAPSYNLLFLRGAHEVRILNARNGQLLDTREAVANFTDLDLTPDNDFLFVADYWGTSDVSERKQTHRVHRYDLVNRTWSMAEAPVVAGNIEAIAADRVLLQETDQHVQVHLNSYSAESAEMTRLSTSVSDYEGDIEYDHHSNQVISGNARSNSHEILAHRIVDDALEFVERVRTDAIGFNGDGTSVLSPDGSVYYNGRLQVRASDITEELLRLPKAIRAASDELAIAADEVFNAADGESLLDLDFDSRVHFVTDDSRHWWTFLPDSDYIRHYALDGKRVGLLAHGYDLDGDDLTYEIVDSPMHGQLTEALSDGTIRYVPNPDFVGSDRFVYRVFDGQGYSPPTPVNIEVFSTAAPDTPPQGRADNFVVQAGNSLDISGFATNDLQLNPGLVLESENDILQVESSPQFGVVALRTELGVTIHAMDDGRMLSHIEARNRTTDMDWSDDGRFLYVADYGADDHYGNVEVPHHVHRFDAASGVWLLKESPEATFHIRVVSSDHYLSSTGIWRSFLSVNDFRSHTLGAIKQLDRISILPGEFDFDSQTGRIYSGYPKEWLSSRIRVSRLIGDELVGVEDNPLTGFDEVGLGASKRLSSDRQTFYYGPLQVEAYDVNNPLRVFPEVILAGNASYAIGGTCFYDSRTGRGVAEHPFQVNQASVSDDGKNIWLLNGKEAHQFVSHATPRGVLNNDFDSNGDPLSAQLESGPTHGTLDFEADGSFVYTPNLEYVGQDQFTYRVASGGQVSEPIDVQIEVRNEHLFGDVNGDGLVSAIDALLLINALHDPTSAHQALIQNPEFDVNQDDFLTALDALIVINEVNRSTLDPTVCRLG